MAEAQGMSEFVDCGLYGTFDKFVFAVASELGKGDNRPSTWNVRMTEDQRQSELRVAELDVRDRDDAIAIRGLADPIERRRGVPFRKATEGSSRQRPRTCHAHVTERRKLGSDAFEDGRVDAAHRLECEDHPLTTPRGTIRATIFVRPAPSATRTTSSTFLYAPGASSTIPALDAARR